MYILMHAICFCRVDSLEITKLPKASSFILNSTFATVAEKKRKRKTFSVF